MLKLTISYSGFTRTSLDLFWNNNNPNNLTITKMYIYLHGFTLHNNKKSRKQNHHLLHFWPGLLIAWAIVVVIVW